MVVHSLTLNQNFKFSPVSHCSYITLKIRNYEIIYFHVCEQNKVITIIVFDNIDL